MRLSRKDDAPRVVGFDLGPAGPPSFPGAPAAPPADTPDAPPPPAWPAADATPPADAPSPAWPAANAAPPGGYPPPPAPGWPAADAAPAVYPPPAGPWAGQAESPVATAPPPAYGGPEYAPRGAFPAPAWTPPAPPKRSLGRMLSLAAGALAVVGGFLVGQQLLGGDEPPAPAPVVAAKKPAKPAGLRLPRTIDGLPRNTSAAAKKVDARIRKTLGAELTPQVGTYSKGRRLPAYQLIASKPIVPTASARVVLRTYSKDAAKSGIKIGAPTAMPGGLSCARVGGMPGPASVCLWNGKRSTGTLMRFGSEDLRALAKLTARVRLSVEGR